MKKIKLSKYFDSKSIDVIRNAQPGEEFDVIATMCWVNFGYKNSILGDQGETIITIDDDSLERMLTILDLNKVDESSLDYMIEILVKFKR